MKFEKIFESKNHKLYKTTGNSEDGTMTQKSITEELGKKVSASVAEGSETIVFSFN